MAKIILTAEVALAELAQDYIVDPDHESGLSNEAYEQLSDAVTNLGFENVEFKLRL